jgi:prephenate dehydrogenase
LIVAVVGVGSHRPGSVGLAARSRLGATVRGFDPALTEARCAAGRSTVPHRDLGDSARRRRLPLFVAVPVDVLATPWRRCSRRRRGPASSPTVGSTKRTVIDGRARPALRRRAPAGRLGGGGGRARARGPLRRRHLVPDADRDDAGTLLERLHRLLTGLGARPEVIDADVHDRVMAAVSHLPHVVANVLVAQAIEALGGERPPATGPSFRDATRVAGANPALWGAIYAANRDALADALDDAIAAWRA